MITEDQLRRIEERAAKAQAGPWKAYIEGRNHESGSNFIMTGTSGPAAPYLQDRYRSVLSVFAGLAMAAFAE
jgi:hypothetical protein